MRRSVLMVGILAVVAGCDKAKPPADAPVVASIDLAAHPTLVFQVFGTRDTTRLLPIAAVVGKEVKAIELPLADWRRLDSIYFAPGAVYTIYRDGRPAGTVQVSRRMWQPDSEPLYTLPGCRDARPMAAVALQSNMALDPAFEFLSMSAPASPAAAAAKPINDLAKQGRLLALSALKPEQLDSADIDTASFGVRSVHLGATDRATIVASQIDANAGDTGPGAGHTTHFLVLGDADSTGAYRVSYSHVESGEARTVEFQRLLDHLDVNADGTDEVFVESWRYAADNELVLLARGAGKWREVMRSKQKWCVRAR